MKNVLSTFVMAICLLFSFSISAQSQQASCASKSFSNCAAAYLNNNMLVDDYSPSGKCVVEEGMKGKLEVSTVNFSFDLAEPFKKVGFKIVIRNEKTNTLWLFSEKTFYEIDLEKILTKCQKGDSIILITVDKEYSLPHNEIAINWGC